MAVSDRPTRLEDALVDLAIIVKEGHLAPLDAHIAPGLVEGGKGSRRSSRA